jgi:Tfp pilus assembly protein PilX
MNVLKIIKKQTGQATLIMVIVIMAVLLIIVASIGLLTYNDLRTIGNSVDSSQSYFAAEAGVEDAVYRIARGKQYTTSYSLTVGSGSTQIDISGPLSALVVTSKGNISGRYRKLEVNLGTTQNTTNVAFNYGVQVGYGGLILNNNSGVNGNVYSNGNITGSNGAFVTGTAIAANSPSSSADQVNDAPATPTSLITFGNAASTQDGAQSFQVATTGPVNNVQMYLRKVSTPGNLTVRITTDSSGNPSSTTLTSATLSASSVTTSYGWVTVNFSSNPQLTAGVTYWLVLDGGNNSSRYYEWAANNTYANGQAKTGPYSGGPWNTTSLDGYFRMYLGGLTGLIDNVDVGTGSVGDARAHTINNSTIAGNNYCQVGSGNNKACNTSQSDPTTQSFPISDANIAQWKTEAEAGGVISGDYTLSNGATASIGPTKITGNMVLSNNVTLTITGTVWVQGTITISNNVIVRLDTGYGAAGGVMLSDGYINLSNNTSFQGSGQATSYFLLISTNDCDGTTSPTGLSCTTANSAIEVGNNVGSVVIYGSRGQVHLSNNAGAKEVTGYKLSLGNNAIVTYETGLASADFSSGPGGGFEISSWKEVE